MTDTTQIEYRTATSTDAEAITNLMLEHRGNLFEFLLQGIIPGMTVHSVLKKQVAIKLNELSHKYTTVAVKDNNVVGILHSYPSSQFKITTGMRMFIPSARLKHVNEFFGNRVDDSLYIHFLTTPAKESSDAILLGLFTQAKEKAQQLKLSKLSTNVWADDQKSLQQFENFGFKQVKTVPVEKNEFIPHEGGSVIMEYMCSS